MQMEAEISKSCKLKIAERLFYYQQLTSKNFMASVSYEQFRGSWAHVQWQRKHKAEISSLRDSMNSRFGWQSSQKWI
jgi:hypothetical protein